MTQEPRRPGAEDERDATADAAPEGASEEARPDTPAGGTAVDDEDEIRDPDPDEPDPESGAAAG